MEDSFNQGIFQKYSKVMNLQDILVYTNPENLSSNANIICLQLIDQEYTPLDYSYCLYTIERYNSLHCQILAKITAEIGRILLSKYNKPEILQELKSQILDRIFLRLNFKSTPHILLYFLEKNGFYEGKEFLPRIIELKRKSISLKKFFLPFIVWFLPLFEAEYPDFYKETVDQFQTNVENSNELFFPFYNNSKTAITSKKHDNEEIISSIKEDLEHDDFNDSYGDFSEIGIYGKYANLTLSLSAKNLWFFRSDVLEFFRKENWKMHTFLCMHGYFPGSIEEAIANDDLESFLQFLKKSNFSFDSKINYNIFFKSHVICSKTTLIEYSAFCSSVKIFRYLIGTLNESEIKDLTSQNLGRTSVPYLAVYSGCQAILKICEEFNVNLDVCIFCAVCFYKHEILSWLIESKNFSVESYSPNYYCPLHQAASSNNIRAVFYLLYKGADLNRLTSPDGEEIVLPVTFGIEFDRYHTTALLLNAKELILDDEQKSKMIRFASLCCDFNLFSYVTSFLCMNDFSKGSPGINFADLKVIEYIYNKIEIEHFNYNLEFFFSQLILHRRYDIAALFYKVFSSKMNMVDSIINYTFEFILIEVVSIFLENEDFLKNKKSVFLLLLESIRFKKRETIKYILSKINPDDLKLSEILDTFEISFVQNITCKSSTLFFKSVNYQKEEFYFLFF